MKPENPLYPDYSPRSRFIESDVLAFTVEDGDLSESDTPESTDKPKGPKQ